MRVLASRKGFSLVELLTVIAIIAILASIIFPVMSMVNNKARMNKCITQMHQIGLGLQIFKQDNRRYPDILATGVQRDEKGDVIPFNRCGTNQDPNAPMGMLPEYVKSSLLFHCPNSAQTDPAKVVDPPGPVGEFYPYDSYDFFIMPDKSGRQHYTRAWANTPADVNSVIPEKQPITGDAASDYERQLKFRTPPDNTVITWCSNHSSMTYSGGWICTGKCPILYLDGHVDKTDAQKVEDYRYRVLPKTE